MLDKYTVVDFETTIRSPISSPAHPMWPDNRIVRAGVLTVDDKAIRRQTTISPSLVDADGGIVAKEGVVWLLSFKNMLKGVVVGHNMKFDLLYALKSEWLTPKEVVNLKVWDTQIAEYLLSAQTSTYPSLDDCAVKYGGVVKDDRIKEMWAAGVPTEKIPEDMLGTYLLGDLENTEKVFVKQWEKAAEWNMLPLIESQMRALLAVTIMEWNGMKVDKNYIDEQSYRLGHEIAAEEKLLSSYVAKYLPDNYGEWKWNSPKDVSLLMFGGTYTVKEKHLVGKYKNGKDKFKLEDVVYEFPCAVIWHPESAGSVKTKLGYYTVDDKVLKNIGGVVATSILRLRECSKQKETYYENLKGLMFPDGFIYPNLNQCSTKTGRLSCNKPNLQNQTSEGGIKAAYVSRWGKAGRIVEFDYQQLEMAGLAVVSGDEQLTQDINDGVDMHTELYKRMYGRAPSKEERKPFKRLSFGLVYGAGKKVLAEQAGCTIEEAAKFITVFYERYKGVASYHKAIIEEAKVGRKLTKQHTVKGHPVGAYLKVSPTGRMYAFKEYDNEWKGGVSFSPTELKNWPVQGFSTGDVVPHMLGVLVAGLVNSDIGDRALPIMTVHDSMEFDVHVDVLDEFVERASRVLKNTSALISKHFSIDIPVKLNVGCSVGYNWGDQEEHV